MFISLSAVDRESAEAYMKIVMSLVMAHDFDYDSTYKRKSNLWMSKIDMFVERFKLNRSRIERAHKKMLASADPNEDSTYKELIDQIVADMHAKAPQMKKELDLRKEDLTLLNDLRLILTRGSEAAFKRLSRVVSRFRDSDINSMFVADHADTTSEQQELEKIVEKYTKKPGLTLPIPILQQWQAVAKKKGKKLADHERYLALRRTINTSFKARLQSLVRTSGKPYLPLADVMQALKAEGVPHTLPSGFVGMIDDHGKFYTTAGKKLAQAPAGEVKMNPQYDPKKDNTNVCSFMPPGGAAPALAYTEAYRSKRTAKKFDVVSQTLPKLNTLAKAWRRHMKNLDSAEGVMATLMEFIFDTSARVSSESAASQGQRTFGATTLQAKHFRINKNSITVTYTGKSAVKQKYVLKGTSVPLRLLIKNLTELLSDKKGSDYVFVHKGKRISGQALNRFMRTLGFPAGFTVHKLRTARATQMARDILTKSKFKRGGKWKEREVNKWVEEQILKVGKELGHMSGEKYTASTAIQSYIEPKILDDFYTDLGIRPPAKIQKAIDTLRGK